MIVASTGVKCVLRTIAGIPAGPVDLEVIRRRRALRSLQVENFIGDIDRVKGG